MGGTDLPGVGVAGEAAGVGVLAQLTRRVGVAVLPPGHAVHTDSLLLGGRQAVLSIAVCSNSTCHQNPNLSKQVHVRNAALAYFSGYGDNIQGKT